MYCSKCQREIDDDSLYCVHCGQQVKRCSYCHKVVGENDQFCSQCGNNLLNNESSNQYQPINTNQSRVEEKLDGYYQPLKDVTFEEKPDERVVFEDIPQKKKVNYKVVGIAFAVLMCFTIVGYYYLKNGQKPILKDPDETTVEPVQNEMVIGSTTSASSMIGNANFNGTSFYDGKNLYTCDDNGYIVKMDSKLENRVTLLRQESKCLNVVGDIIYYTNSLDQLCSITTEGKDQKVILNQSVFYLNVKGDKAYYQLDEGQGEGEYICVYDLKTNKQTKLNDRASYNLNILDDKIYYTSSDGIYSMGLDGKGEEKLVSGKVTNAIVQSDKIYYGQPDKGTISYYDIKDKKIEDVITKDNMYLLNITEQYLFYLNNEGNILRYDLKSKDIKKVYYSGVASDLQIVGDKIIVTVNGQQYKNKSSYKVIMDFDGNTQQRLFTESDGSFI
ncbi:MAG: DUF5050 domain-containing protein [Coprobacillus sp.]